MNASLSLMGCLQELAIFFVEVALITGLGYFLERRIRHAPWRRTCWQGVGILLLAAILIIFFNPISYIKQFSNLKLTSSESLYVPAIALPSSGSDSDIEHSSDFKDRQKATQALRSGSGIKIPQAPEITVASTTELGESEPARDMAFEKLADQYLSGNASLWIGLLWIAGSMVVGFRTVLAHALLWILSLRYREITEASLLRRVADLSQRMGMKARVRLLAAPFGSPISFGIRRPTIVVARNFAYRYAPEQQDAILSHELGHLSARDPLWLMVMDIVVAAWWWHPLAWVARRRYHAAAEFAADDASALVEDGPTILAECLVALGSEKAAARMPVWLSMAGVPFRSDLGLRVERLLSIDTGVGPSKAVSFTSQSTTAGILTVIAGASLIVLTSNFIQKGDTMNILNQTWRRAFVAFTLFTALEGEFSPMTYGKPQAVATNTTNDKAALASDSNTNKNTTSAATNMYGLSPEMMKRYGLVPPTNSNPQPANQFQMSPEMMKRYGLIAQNSTNAPDTNRYQGMSPELMRRYGLTPRQVAPGDTNTPFTNIYRGMSPELMKRYGLIPPTNSGSQSTIQYQMSPELMRRYGLTPPQADSADTNSPVTNRFQGMSPEMMRRYGLIPPTNNPSQTTNRYQMSPELMRRYGLTPPQADSADTNSPVTNRFQGMSPEMMRRYGIIPPTNNPSQSTNQNQMSPELMRRYGLIPRQNKSEGTNSSASEVIVNSIGMKLKLVQPGTFKMLWNRRELTEITNPYYLGIYEVTQSEWEEIMGTSPAHFKGKNLPVESVSWHDTQVFLKRLSDMEKKTYRLPTEAEWEYACYAGSGPKESFGPNDNKLLEGYCWFKNNSEGNTHPVGTKKSNKWGFYDMQGNVWEWCLDWKSGYNVSDGTDSNEPSYASPRILRGGGYDDQGDICWYARMFVDPRSNYKNYGFRVVLEPSKP